MTEMVSVYIFDILNMLCMVQPLDSFMMIQTEDNKDVKVVVVGN